MIRKALVAISVVLFLGSFVLWMAGHRVGWYYQFHRPSWKSWGYIGGGTVHLGFVFFPAGTRPGVPRGLRWEQITPAGAHSPYSRHPMGMGRRDGDRWVGGLPFIRWGVFTNTPPGVPGRGFTLGFAWFGVTLIFAIYPVYVVTRYLRRPRGTFCTHCAYDLTGNESGVCPECGTKIGS